MLAFFGVKIIGLDQVFLNLNPTNYRTLSDYAIANPTYKKLRFNPLPAKQSLSSLETIKNSVAL